MITSNNFDVILCDDIRREDNGKHILLGVYGSNMLIGQFPAHFFMAAWLRFNGAPKGHHRFQFMLTGTGDDPSTSTAEGEFIVNDPSLPLVLTFVGMPVELANAGTMKSTVKLDDDEPIELVGLSVQPLATPQAQTSEPAS